MSQEITPTVNQAEIKSLAIRVDDIRSVQRQVRDTLIVNEGRLTKLETTYAYNNTLLMTLCGGLAVLLIERFAQYVAVKKKE